jgi:homoserine kinase
VSTKQIEVYSPASIANLGPGFDVFGVALDEIGDTLRLKAIQERDIRISVCGKGASSISSDPPANSAGAVLKQIVEGQGLDHGFEVELEKGVPVGKGMGSSGASAAAAAFAATTILRLEISKREMVQLAAIGEAAVSGSPHADNVSASLFGGFTMVGSGYDVIRLDPPPVEIVVVVPDVDYENKTRLARSLLPETVLLKEAVLNVGNASRMAAAVALGDAVLFGRSICDNLVEPRRAEMIPNFWKVKAAALESGAYGCSIAGGGPSVFAVGEDPNRIGRAMAGAFGVAGVGSEVYKTRPSRMGARVI